MARFRFFAVDGNGVDMGPDHVVVGEVSGQTARLLRFSDGDHVITYSGTFTKLNGLYFGTLDGFTETDGGERVLTVTDLDKNLGTFGSYYRHDEFVGAFNYIISGNDTIIGTGFADALLGGGGRDVIRGGGGKDTISGNARRDKLLGDGGGDLLDGGSGHDRLYGGAGNDRIIGGRGDDVLRGDAGRDVMFGGFGSDRFVFADRFDFAPRKRPDVIADFSRARDDRIDLSAIDADTFKAGEQAFTFIGSEAFSETAGELRFRNGMLSGDVQGDGTADFYVAVENVSQLSVDDFLL